MKSVTAAAIMSALILLGGIVALLGSVLGAAFHEDRVTPGPESAPVQLGALAEKDSPGAPAALLPE